MSNGDLKKTSTLFRMKKMKLNPKKILLLATIALFFILAPVGILYSHGYRLDLENKKVVKTGGLYFNVQPGNARIHVDGKKPKTTNAFFGSLFLESIKPGKYGVRITKSGFQDWEKTLSVEAEKVTSAKNVHLVPETLSSEIIFRGIEDVWFSNAKQQAVLLEGEDNWSLKIFDMQEGIKSHLLFKKDLPQKEDENLTLKEVIWPPQKGVFLIQVLSKEAGEENSLETEGEESSPKNLFFYIDSREDPVQIKRVNISPEAKRVTFASSEHILFLTPNEKSSTLFKRGISGEGKRILEDVEAFALHGGKIFWIDNQGFLKESNFEGDELNTSLETLPEIGEKTEVYPLGFTTLVKSNGNLFELNRSQTFERVKSSALNLEFSPGVKKVALWTDHEIELLMLKEQTYQPLREKGEKIFLTRSSKEIENVFWWKEDYLLVIKNGGEEKEITVLEADNRDKVQSWTLKKLSAEKIIYNPGDKRFLFLTKKRLFQTEEF